mmetsp:Transcript_3881/g.6090  ORF Transcript_3881/g.6090 Transcript_3881/m.6090 type:complete len:675 (+) Transcript_3881:99-2123(+)
MPEEVITKRARRKLGANPSQLWPQMPKIATPAARAKAYLRVAGLSTSLKGSAIDPELDLNAPEIKFGRLLASPEERVRHTAVRRLNQYLTERCVIDDESVGLSELDLLKLWKGLWYTLYMADRVPVQDELAKKLAELLWCVAGNEEEDEYAGKAYLDMYGDVDDDHDDDHKVVMEEISNTIDSSNDEDDNSIHSVEMNSDLDENESKGESDEEDEQETDNLFIPHCRGAHLSALMLKTFLQTIRREWGRMDKYRIDKFYTVIRLMMGEVYKYMAKRHWNLGIIRLFNDTLYEQVLSQVPNGLRFHLIDISLEELAEANAEAPMPLTEATFLDVLEPYTMLSQSCDDKIVQSRVIEKIFRTFLEKYSVICDLAMEENREGSEQRLIMDQVHIGTVADFIFQLASHTETMDMYRDSLYETFKDYKRRLKEIGKDVSLDTEERLDDDSEDVDENDDKVRTVLVDDPMNLNGQSFGVIVDEESMYEDENPTKKEKKKDSETEEKHGSTTVKKRKRKKDKLAKASETVFEEGDKINGGKKNYGRKKKSEVDIDQDEVINISLAEQQHAKQAAITGIKTSNSEETSAASTKKDNKKKKKKKKKADEIMENVDEVTGDKRRVSFGKVNHSKSHKASMKALKNMSSPTLESVTPEKSILRSKKPNTSVSAVKKGRQKAVDYF